jgi:hypothetical protein
MAADKTTSPFQIIVLSEFTHTAPIESHSQKVFHGSCAYEMIIRLDILCNVNFKIDFKTNLMNYIFITVPMHTSNNFDDTMCLVMFPLLILTSFLKNMKLMPEQYFNMPLRIQFSLN